MLGTHRFGLFSSGFTSQSLSLSNNLLFISDMWLIIISYTLSREYRVVRYRYSRLLFTSEDRLCANLAHNKWRHNASASRSRDVTDQLWWRHNVKSEKTVASDNGEMSDRWLFVAERCVQDIQRVRNEIIHSLQWITIFWSLVRWFASDFANHPTRDQKLVIHGNSCIILYM